MKILLACVLCLAVPVSSFAADNGYKIIYDGGSISDLKAGSKANLHVDTAVIKLADGNKEIISIAPATVTEVSYGQDVHRRIGTAIDLAVISLGNRSPHGFQQIQEALHRSDLRRRGQEGRFCHAM